MLNTLQKNFRVRPLTAAVASIISLTAGSMAYAQDDAEEIVVTGIKASLQQAMDIKRDAVGVVDAINAEDMGKFPDTNLAESMQRITGVSIDRSNGEGSRITVRGFGGDNNMVTLNGRVMPAASLFPGAGGSGVSRAFDFSNLASESVAGVEVYKTGRASVATGGIGASVNIKTAKPLDHDGFKASVGAKALSDTTNRTGSDVTPEISGLVSFSDTDAGWGVGLTASHQERDSGSSDVTENQWNIGKWTNAALTDNSKGLFSFKTGAKVTNAPKEGQLYSRPNDLRYAWSDNQRTRDNAQLTLQWAPSDKITGTLDYTYAKNNLQERRGETTSWLQNGNSIDEVIFNNTTAVATPVYIHETAGPRDQGYEQQFRKQETTLKSLGFNLDFQVTDALKLTFDAHNSKAESLPDGGKSGSNDIAVSMGTPTQVAHSLDFRNKTPLFSLTIDDSKKGNKNGKDDAGDVGSQPVRIGYSDQISEIDEYRLDGTYKFDDGHFDFGVQSRQMESSNRSSSRYMAMGDWGIANVGDIPANMITPFNVANFDSLKTGGSYQGGYKADAEKVAEYLVNLYKTPTNGYCFCYEPNFTTNDKLKEDIQSAYFQVGVQGELGGMKTNFLVGIRYESTDVDSASFVRPPSYLEWQDDNDFATHYDNSTKLEATRDKSSYDNLLPSFDFDISLRDDLKARISASQTIARAPYGNLSAAVTGFGSGGGSTANGAIRVANVNNPRLLPLQSNNVDVSVEWYYADSSYLSAGVFEKRVSNFIGTEKTTKQFFGIQDQTNAQSPRVQAAIAALKAGGYGVNDSSLFTMMAMIDNPGTFTDKDGTWTGGAANYNGLEAQHQAFATKYDIIPRSDDPVSNWLVSEPVNNKEAKLYGAEFAAQHFFGDSGFGLQANYTIVRGDVGYDNAGDPNVSQFALLGLSDTANLVGMYEKNGWQARIAYNWRGEFLRSASQGSFRNPVYTEAYSQIDATISYAVNDNLTITADGLNLTGEDRRDHGRTYEMVEYMIDLGPRYTLGARYTF
ncbi:TonB-dependent receptor [Cellvibrio sp.]|uniref:TonB-dependent receptor n=1 Tax=Cellvibrio sp. TaxID=1965322 RepID=UPI0039647441